MTEQTRVLTKQDKAVVEAIRLEANLHPAVAERIYEAVIKAQHTHERCHRINRVNRKLWEQRQEQDAATADRDEAVMRLLIRLADAYLPNESVSRRAAKRAYDELADLAVIPDTGGTK